MLSAALVSFGLLQAPSELEALKRHRAAFEMSPDDPELALALGSALARLGVTDEALEVLEIAREKEPERPEPYLLAALALRDAHRQKEAVALLEHALSAGAGSAPVYEELGYLLLSLGGLERARSVGREGLERYPESAHLKMVLGLALATAREHAKEATELLSAALEGGAPDPSRLHLALGSSLLSLGRADAALSHLEKAVALEPESAEAHFRLGNALREANDTEGARAALDRFQALRREADHEERRERILRTAINEAQRLALSDRLAEALEALSSITSEHPEDPRAYVLAAKVLSSLARDVEALESLRAAKRLSPADVEHYLLEGRFLLKLERFEAATSSLLTATALDSGLAEAYELLGVAEANQGHHQRAVFFFEQARDRGADSAGLYLNLAESLRKLGRDEEAERALEAYRAK